MPRPYSSYRRTPQSLPDPSTLPFPGNLVRGCSDCDLRAGCKAPVPGDGSIPAEIMLVGEAPGAQEDEWGYKPFVGQAGQYLDSLLFQIGLNRESIYITNTVRCRPPRNRDPLPSELKACAKWLNIELEIVSPRIVVAMGAPAIAHFLRQGAGTVEHLHGKPIEVKIGSKTRILLPCYHPAAALHNTTLLRQCADDFQVLRGLVRGGSLSEYLAEDEYPNPDYRVADTLSKANQMMEEVRGAKECAVDVETIKRDTELWSIQTSAYPGTAWFFRPRSEHVGKVDTTLWNSHIIVHYYLNDIKWLDIPDGNFTDTMTQAYLCVARATLVLKADLTWVRADEVRVGDELVGFDETYGGRAGNRPHSTAGFSRRHLKKADVEQTLIRQAECFDVVLSDGRNVVCTGDHKWLVGRLGCKRLEWLSVAEIAGRMTRFCRGGPYGGRPAQYRIRSLVPRPWEVDETHDGGWLAGLIDGEGSLSAAEGNGAFLSVAQRMGPVCRKVEELLGNMGFKVNCKLYNDSSKEVNDVFVVNLSGLANIMRLLGQIRPVRLSRDFWIGKAFPNHGDEATILSVTPVGVQDVVSITTSARTYIANGLASHNCGLPQGLKELASRLCGINMVSYLEMVRPGQRKLSTDYLVEATEQEWPDPPNIEETKWNNKQGKIITRIKKPWRISRKIAKIIKDTTDNLDIDPYRRWLDIPELERAEVEKKLGVMPESSLADIKFEDAVQYACRDSDATLRVKHKMDKLISQLGLDFTLRMDTAILPMVDEMMRTGMAVDLDHLRELSVDYDARMRAKSVELASMIGRSFNPNSRPQVASVVYGELGFTPTRLTPTKEISTDDQELKKTKHPVAKGVIEYRRLSKMKGTYADALVEWAIPDESSVPRIHTTLKTTRTETGRLASADPNLQNQPVRSKEGKAIRQGFVASPGWRLGEGDLAQIEMVSQAHLAKCKGLIDVFLRGDDLHTMTASMIFGVPYEEAKKEKYRYPTKRANFGIIYMIGASGLSDQIQEYIADLEMEGEPVEVEPWDVLTCEKFIGDWYKLYPEVKDYQSEMTAMARRYGYVSDIFGRIRYVPEVSCPIRSVQEAGLRQAANMPVQATAQGIIKLAMGELWRGLPKTGWRDNVRWLMQIHDSLIVEVADDESVVRPYLKWMEKVMTGVVGLVVPVRVDFKVGMRWGELEKYELEG